MKASSSAARFLHVLAAAAALTLLSAAAQTTTCTPAPAGLVGWWRAETNGFDSAGANHGTLLPGVSFAAGQVGQAFAFNGETNSFIEVPDSPALQLTNELTIEFWVKRLRLTFPSYPYSDYIVEKGGDWTGYAQNYAVALHNASYNYCLHFAFAGGWRGAGSIADTNSWHHCAVVARNGDANPTFYIDGVEQALAYSEGATALNLYPSTRPLHIGALLDPVTGWYYFSDTLVDELSVYSRALNTAEIQAIYAAGSAGKCTNAPSPFPPFIAVPPTNQTVNAGSTVAFSVGATGTAPLSYQWFFANAPLDSQTEPSLVLNNVQAPQAGDYFVVVTNLYGAATSEVATLSVQTFPPNITAQPQGTNVYAGTAVTFRVGATGSPTLAYQWLKNSLPLASATASSYTLQSAQLTDSGTYSVIVTNLYGAATSSPALLLVRQPPPCDPPPAGLVSWWRAENNLIDAWGDNDAIAGYPNSGAVYTAGKVGAAAFSFSGNTSSYLRVLDSPSLHFTNALTIEGWVNPTSAQTSSSRTILAKYDDLANILSATNSSFYLGLTNNGALYFMVASNGLAARKMALIAPSPLPLSQWSHVAVTYDGTAVRLYVNGSQVSKTNYSARLLPGTTDVGIGAIPGDVLTGNYVGTWPWVGGIDDLSLYNRALSEAEVQALYSADVTGKCLVPPTIISQPQNQAVPLGEDVKFSLVLRGTKPFTYQWRFNTQPLQGATSAALVLEKVQSNRVGGYSVLVTNSQGSALSANAQLTLLPAPVCVSPPGGMLGWWPADASPADGAGTNNASAASPAIPPSYANGKVAQAFIVGGAFGRYTPVSVAHSASLNLGNNTGFSLEAWIKYIPASGIIYPPFRITSAVETIVSKESSGILFPPVGRAPSIGYALLLAEGRLACRLGAANGRVTNSATFLSVGPDLRDSMFHHVALSVDRTLANGGNLYVDGVPVLTFNATSLVGSLDTTTALGIGSGSSATEDDFSGLIDEFTLYNRALSAGEVLAIRQAGAAGKCKVPPFVLSQPTSQLVTSGSNATFSVTATGGGVLRYQWRRNTQLLAGATASSYTVTNAQIAGSYSVVVSNAFGSALSSNALLSINHFPVARALNVTVPAGPGCLADVSVDDQSVDPDQDPLTLTQSPPGPYPLGTNLVTLTATDSHGLSSSATAVVVVVDRTPPVVTCPPPVTQANDLNQCGAVVNYPPVTANDLCSAVTNLTCVPSPGSFFPIGATLVQCTATDAAGNVGRNSFTVTIKDTQTPTITCPADMVVTNAHDAWSSVVTYSPSATDNCPGVSVPGCAPASGSAFSLGVHPVTCSVTDAAGNTNQCSFTVTVKAGNQPPVPVIQVAPLASFPGNTNLLVIAPACTASATAYFDGSRSSDPDGDPLNYAWKEGTNCFAHGPVATNSLSLGQHDILLWVDDTFPLGTNEAIVTVTVLSPNQAVGIISNLLGASTLPRNRQHPLQVSLDAAAAAFDHCDTKSGRNELQAFENKVRAQVAGTDPVMAGSLLQAADQLLTALNPTSVAGEPGLKPHSLSRKADGKVHLKFNGQTARVPLVQASTNLIDWTTLGFATDNGDGTFEFEDAQAGGLPNRFYRIICP